MSRGDEPLSRRTSTTLWVILFGLVIFQGVGNDVQSCNRQIAPRAAFRQSLGESW